MVRGGGESSTDELCVAGGVKKTCLFKQQFCTKNTHRYTHKSCEVEEEDWPQRERVGERAEREQEKTNEHECESELVIAHTRTHGRATLTHGVALLYIYITCTSYLELFIVHFLS